MKKINYKLIKKDGEARYGLVETNYGTFETPMFMPVGTRGSVKGLTPEQVKEFQKAKGLEQTGKVDEKTAEKLGII